MGTVARIVADDSFGYSSKAHSEKSIFLPSLVTTSLPGAPSIFRSYVPATIDGASGTIGRGFAIALPPDRTPNTNAVDTINLDIFDPTFSVIYFTDEFMEVKRPRPTKADLEAARSKVLHDVIASGLDVLFCGINPGLYTTAIGHHFGRPGNRFWPALYESGFTPRLYSPYEDRDLLKLGYGVTNFVARTTARADELTNEEMVQGARELESKLLLYKPRYLAVLGIGAYKTGFGRKNATYGEQPERIGDTRIWVLPNPSGLNANFQMPELARMFAELKRAASA
jgi:TDG/mug DNA glycosylase family protein